jgi:hypothetical protein
MEILFIILILALLAGGGIVGFILRSIVFAGALLVLGFVLLVLLALGVLT